MHSERALERGRENDVRAFSRALRGRGEQQRRVDRGSRDCERGAAVYRVRVQAERAAMAVR